MGRREKLLDRLHTFAEKYRDNQEAAEVLMSFFRGECIHLTDSKGRCELCDTNQPHKVKN